MKRYGKDFDEKESLEYMATGTQGKLKKVGFESTTPIIRKSEAVSTFTSNLFIYTNAKNSCFHLLKVVQF